MSEQRDELARAIFNAPALVAWNGQQKDIAKFLISKGWTKPRTIKGYGELCALKYGSAVQTSDDSDTVVLRSDGMDFVNQSGHTVAAPVLWDFGSKPFFVLYEPTP